MKRILIVCCCILFSCSVQKRIGAKASVIINDTILHSGTIGISIYDAENDKYLYRYNADKYFVPASNVKLFTAYAALLFLPDSIPGIKVMENQDAVYIAPTGDPTFLHPSFPTQRVYDFLKNTSKSIYILKEKNTFQKWGNGWLWDDYNDAYMPERCAFPVYGNVVKFDNDKISIPVFRDSLKYPVPGNYNPDQFFSVRRQFYSNQFIFSEAAEKQKPVAVPFITSDALSCKFLSDTLHKNISITNNTPDPVASRTYYINSQSRDTVLAMMMHNSDNFLAEQLMLIMSKQQYGIMTDAILEYLSAGLLKDIPQPMKWKDASGLSRYNQCTPDDIIYVLQKMKMKIGIKKLDEILPKGNEGTLKNYFITEDSAIHAKTGSMSNIYCLSGYMITRKNKLLFFSILANNIPGLLSDARRKIETFLKALRAL